MELDESILVNRDWLGKMLEHYLVKRLLSEAPTSCLWDFSLSQLRGEFLKATKDCGIAFLQPVLYMGRHTGASLDRLENNLSLEEVQKRGRWRTSDSVRRYEKRALVQEVLSKMLPRDVEFCQRCEATLERDLWQRLRAAKRI